MLFPPVQPKPRPITELQEAVAIILEAEVRLEPDDFEEWLKARPGALVIYAVLANGDSIAAEVLQEVRQELKATPAPEVQMPATLSELLDANGRMPPWRDAPPPPERADRRELTSIAEDQWRNIPPQWPKGPSR